MKRSINPVTKLPFQKPQTAEDRIIDRAAKRALKRSREARPVKVKHGRKS